MPPQALRTDCEDRTMSWLKIETHTPEKPEIAVLSSLLNLDPDVVFAKCFRFWRWADAVTTHGRIARTNCACVDQLVSTPGFAAALIEVGWLQERGDALVLPNFTRHMGKSAKTRALAAARQSRRRHARSVTNVTPDVTRARDESRSKSRTEQSRTEQSRTEEIKDSSSSSIPATAPTSPPAPAAAAFSLRLSTDDLIRHVSEHLSQDLATQLVTADPELADVVVPYFEQRLADPTKPAVKSPSAMLRSMLESPGNSGFTRAEGKWLPPKTSPPRSQANREKAKAAAAQKEAADEAKRAADQKAEEDLLRAFDSQPPDVQTRFLTEAVEWGKQPGRGLREDAELVKLHAARDWQKSRVIAG
jgi:hypothetical protein